LKIQDTKIKLKLKREKLRRLANSNLYDFINYVKYDYEGNWHHKLIADKIQEFWEHDTKNRLMLFVPPQHGKSEIASRNLPAWVLGINPDTKVAAASYSIDLARSFNRMVQRIIDSNEYKQVFPKTELNSKNVASDSKGNYLRNTEEFEIVGAKGSYKSVGVMGGLSGRAVDLAIIDDPVKDRLEANSQTYRDRIYDWYLNVLETRLHNKSKVLLIMTRWHEDDLAGRLLIKEPDQWEVIKIPAIKEANQDYITEGDNRKVGEALWESKHSLEKLMRTKHKSESVFESLYQQNPTPAEGNKIKKEWFEYCHEKELPNITWDIWVDGAYTKNTSNDPTGFVIAGYDEKTKKIYIKHAHDSHMEMPKFLSFIKTYADSHGLDRRSRVRFEPKASGKSMRQMVNSETDLSATEIKSKLIQEGKEARIQTAAPRVESGKVVLVKGNWNDGFVNQICSFPNAPHDEYVDLIGYICDYYDSRIKKSGIKRRN
jgi:predicted phage terminase large subunit-like protein